MESKAEVYKLKIKAAQKTPEIQKFFSVNNLILEEQNGYWLISKPWFSFVYKLRAASYGLISPSFCDTLAVSDIAYNPEKHGH